MNRRRLVPWTFLVADLSALGAAIYIMARWFYNPVRSLAIERILSMRLRLQDITISIILISIWVLLFWCFGLYQKRHVSFMKVRHYNLIDLIKAVSLGTLIPVMSSFFVGLPNFTAKFTLVFWFISILGTLISREILNLLLWQMRLHGRNLRHLLIVGSNARAQSFASRVQQQPELGYSLLGFVDNDWDNSGHTDIREPGLVANRKNFGEYLNTHVVDEVLITLPIATLYREASRIVKICENHGIVVHFVPGFDFLNIGSSSATFDTLDGEPIINLLPPPMANSQFAVKRVIDVIGATSLIFILSPVLVLVAMAVKFTSEGPIFFVQNRVGLNKRKFPMIKFRTMQNNAEGMQQSLEHLNEAKGPVFKIESDPRITSLGGFLRRTSLDELPQLFNVLRGDMSLVGPRPLPLRDYAGFDQDWHRRRFSVRPGITCLWQVRGRSSISFDKWMELDMEYINNWSIRLDIGILAQTVLAVLERRGAV